MFQIKLINILLLLFFYYEISCSQPLTLYDSIEKALNYNQTIMYAVQKNYLSAWSQLNLMESAYRSQMNLNLNTAHNYSRTFGGDSYYESWYQVTTPNFDFSYTLLTPFGSRTHLGIGYQTQIFNSHSFYSSPQFMFSFQQPLSWSGIQAGHADLIRARRNFISSEISYQLQKEGLIISVINSYFQLWQAFKNIEQSDYDLQSAKRVLDIAELRLKAGQLSEFEVMNIRVQYQVAEDNLKVAQNSLQTQKRSFLRLLGQDLNTEIQLAEEIQMDTIDFHLDYAIQTAFQNRLEIKQREISLELAELNLQQTKATAYPTLYLNGNYSLSSQYDASLESALWDYPNRYWRFQASLSFPILDGGARSNHVQIAKYAYKIQLKNLELFKEDIAIDIEENFRSLKLNQNRINSLTLSLKIAEEALNISELRFKQGQISSTEIENIRQRFTNAQRSLNSAKISYVTKSAQLARAMGILGEWVERQKD
jgi:outer membrane protein